MLEWALNGLAVVVIVGAAVLIAGAVMEWWYG